MHMYPNAHNIYSPHMMSLNMHPPMISPLDPIGVGIGPPNLSALRPMGYGMGMGVPNFHSYNGLRPRRNIYNHDAPYPYGYGYGGRGVGSRYIDPYDLFDDFYDDELDVYLDDYDDIDDPLMLWLRMQRGGGGERRRGRRSGRYGGRYGYGGRMDYRDFLW